MVRALSLVPSRLVLRVTHGGCERTSIAVNGASGHAWGLDYVQLPNVAIT